MTSKRGVISLFFLTALAGCDGPSSPADAGSDGGFDAGPPECTVDTDCDDGQFCSGVEVCDPAHPEADARGCVSGPGPCAASESCDEGDDTCVLAGCEEPDADGDGLSRIECGGIDCDDEDPLRFAGNVEICDTADRDEDCDPTTFGYRDGDGDEYPDATCCNTDETGALRCGDDCNDSSAGVNPGEADGCNDRDDDCDGVIDEDGMVLYLDCDGDGFGNSAVSRVGCPAPVTASEDCPSPLPSSTWTTTPGDCDDLRTATHPGAADTCNGIDDDCMLPTDPSTCLCTEGETTACGYDASCTLVMGTCVSGAFACPPGLRTGAEAEVCDGIDNNCDGGVDEGCPCSPVGATRDCTSEGRVGACAVGTERCEPTGWAGCPAPATEICSPTDEDCDGTVDEQMHVWTANIPQPCAGTALHNSYLCPLTIANECTGESPPADQCGATGGFGHVELGPGVITIVCTDLPTQRRVPGATLRMHHAGCEMTDGAFSACRSAMQRYCASRGSIGGFGWHDGPDTWAIQCLSSAQATLHRAAWADLTAIQPSCTGYPADPVYCPSAVHRWCTARGFLTGYGPVEQSPADAYLLCIRDF